MRGLRCHQEAEVYALRSSLHVPVDVRRSRSVYKECPRRSLPSFSLLEGKRRFLCEASLRGPRYLSDDARGHTYKGTGERAAVWIVYRGSWEARRKVVIGKVSFFLFFIVCPCLLFRLAISFPGQGGFTG